MPGFNHLDDMKDTIATTNDTSKMHTAWYNIKLKRVSDFNIIYGDKLLTAIDLTNGINGIDAIGTFVYIPTAICDQCIITFEYIEDNK